MTITEFIEARLGEDETRFAYGCEGTGEYESCAELSDRSEAAMRAMRQIVGNPSGTTWSTLAALAAIWSDHPDYDEQWRMR